MSIKKLFGASDTSRNYLSDTTEQELFEEIESARNLEELRLKQEEFVPQVNYADPMNFVRYGSAYLYYKSAVERIVDYYPYDGSDYEINQFYNNSLEIEKYIFNNLYPRTNGHGVVTSDSWGTLSGSLQSGYGLSTTLEYIDFKGGPHTVAGALTPTLFKDPKSSKIKSANIYDTDIYTTAGLPSDYGSGSRESNLKADFDRGVTVEFWAKTGSLSTALTNKQVLVDIWNNELSCSAYGGAAGANPNPHYGRVTIAFNGTAGGAATATIVGTAALAGESGTSFILTNTDGSTVTFTTDPTLNFGDVTADIGDHTWRVNTGGSFSSDGIRKATQASWIACKGAIDAGELDMSISPTSFAGTETEFTLTQTTAGTAGNTAITLITGVTANGETNFTGGQGGLPGASYDQLPGFHKVNRNRKLIPRLPKATGAGSETVASASVYDNFYVQHPIPRSTRQYSWITSSLMHYGKYDLLRYYGIPTLTGPRTGLYSSSVDGYVSYFDFVSSSEIFSPTFPDIFQPTTRLNTLTLEPVESGISNVVGHPAADFAADAGIYFNAELINSFGPTLLTNPVSAAVAVTQANYFNLLMTRRNNTFGWNWRNTPGRRSESPIITAERLSCSITVITGSLAKFRLASVSMRGRPTEMCWNDYDAVDQSVFDASDPMSDEGFETTTVKSTNNNWKVFFNETELDDLQYSYMNITTPFDQLLNIVVNNPLDSNPLPEASIDAWDGYDLQWIIYTENVFPSLYNEFNSSSLSRLDYDNEFWRGSNTDRITLGSTFKNSFNITVNQSSWPLDPPVDFLTRTQPTTVANVNTLRTSDKAGELQNSYFHVWRPAGAALPEPTAVQSLSPSGLYARKHMLCSPSSVVARTGVRIAETASTSWAWFDEVFQGPPDGTTYTGHVKTGSGEAVWEVGPQAGYITNRPFSAFGEDYQFNSAPSDPWWDEYNDFKYELKLVAKDFSIVPEFRISNHIEDYVNLGVLPEEKFDTFEIPGTIFSSSYIGFYKDFPDSEFMKDFITVKSDSGLNAREIRLVCNAAIRFNPYKGFYPAQRTLDLVSQFSKSYGDGITLNSKGTGIPFIDAMTAAGGAFRPLMQPLFSPGILYNSIKSGMAVDYPVVLDGSKIAKEEYKAESGPCPEYALGTNMTDGPAADAPVAYNSGAFWDKRLPFETMLNPSRYIDGLAFQDMEPHLSATLNVTASWSSTSDSIYELMARNFFGEVGSFFLKDNTFTKLKSGWISISEGDKMPFNTNYPYGARLKIRRSTTGPRTYEFESGSTTGSGSYGLYGGKYWDAGTANETGNENDSGFITGSEFSLPQDPRLNQEFKETFTMYSRPTAFGPPCTGRPSGSLANHVDVRGCRPLDCFDGFNWAFTPPYYHGEAWVDFVFWPIKGKKYTSIDMVLSELSMSYWRVDPGILTSSSGPLLDTSLISSFPAAAFNIGSNAFRAIYDGRNINSNAMQVSASLNLFGVESMSTFEVDIFGAEAATTIGASPAGERWVIQPKWETPMLNFNDEGIHPITNANGTLSVPTFGAGSVPRGMWHQFGVIPESTKKGIFMEIGDIPTNWLKYHYDVVTNNSMYNKEDASTRGSSIHSAMRSLVDAFDFNSDETSQRLGEIEEEITIKEAVVAVPYISNEGALAAFELGLYEGDPLDIKEFISIPQERVEAAQEAAWGSEVGDTLYSAGESIRKLLRKMDRYVLPPQFDFLNNDQIDPIVMYIFEFEYTLDRDDLSYIWQNTAPKDYRQITFATESIAHELNFNELLDEDNIMDNENLRWMVFKVKQKAETDYWDHIVDQVDPILKSRALVDETGYPIAYNWPYDFLSFVELVKLDVEVKYDTSEPLEVVPSMAEEMMAAMSTPAEAAAAAATAATELFANRPTARRPSAIPSPAQTRAKSNIERLLGTEEDEDK